ncbi:unnamed protein product [Amoebophrya sp. A25]|nr:unnamed protein product [Amoebophrya sp. A25]|eukprot:GSA25T00008250001.1
MENEAKRLTMLWLKEWYHPQWSEALCPANGRFDFHLSWNRENDGSKPELWVCEITECGASLCGLPIELRNSALSRSLKIIMPIPHRDS